jgi:hypothetical protein
LTFCFKDNKYTGQLETDYCGITGVTGVFTPPVRN